MMSTPWFVVKYVPDLYRREPRNVGIVLLHEGVGHVRFLGQDPLTGDLDVTRVQQVVPETRSYQAWIHYFTHHAELGTWPQVERSLSRRSFDNFLIEEGGSWELDFESPQTLLAELYRTMVERKGEAADATTITRTSSLVRKVFEAAHIVDKIDSQPKFEVEIRGARGSARTEIGFDYQYTNGSVTLMERMPLGAQSPRENMKRVTDLLYRIERLTDAPVPINRFIALYHVSGAEDREPQEVAARELSILETSVDVLDVTNIPEAANDLRRRLAPKR